MTQPTQKLSPATTGFSLAAAVTVLFNTVLAWAKDLSPALNDFMKSVAGHHWTTHGLADLVLFGGLGAAFTITRTGDSLSATGVTSALLAAVTLAAIGLAAWFAFV